VLSGRRRRWRLDFHAVRTGWIAQWRHVFA
jgi:hypothetical protein